MPQVPKRFSVAIAFPRDGGEALVLGVSTKQSELLPLLDQCDPAEVAVAGVCKDIQFSTRKTYPAPEGRVGPVGEPGPKGPAGKEKLEDYSDEELRQLVAPEYKVDPAGKSREQLIAAIYSAAGYKDKEPQQ